MNASVVHVTHLEPPQDRPDALALSLAPVELVDELHRAAVQAGEHVPRVGEAAAGLHLGDGVALDVVVGGALAQDGEEHAVVVRGGRADGVQDGEGELALGQVLGEAL